MGYFRELPNLQYQSFLSDNNSSQNYLLVKNIFRRCKLRNDLQNIFTLFNKYQIVDGSRPDTVAEEFYGSADLDWVVLMTAGITNVRDQWPLSNHQLYKFAEKKYDDLNAVHHYETKEVKDSLGNIIIPKGKVVDSNFSIRYYDENLNRNVTFGPPWTSISNLRYENIENDKKRSIYLLKREYLQDFIDDMRREMSYNKSSQYVSSNVIRTENTKTTMP